MTPIPDGVEEVRPWPGEHTYPGHLLFWRCAVKLELLRVDTAHRFYSTKSIYMRNPLLLCEDGAEL